MGGGEVVCELAEFIHHQARDGISQNLKSQAGVHTKTNLDTDNNNARIRHVGVVFSPSPEEHGVPVKEPAPTSEARLTP